MRSLFLIRYTMQGGSLSVLPFYTHNLAEALRKFHAIMAGLGCERDKYRVSNYREIDEPAVRLTLDSHRNFINQLSPDEQRQFFQDRHERHGLLKTNSTMKNLTRLKAKEYV